MKLFGLIGFPLSHSFSASYFSEKFSREKITGCEYTLFPLPDISLLPDLVKAHPDLAGFNVTIPYKEKIIPYLDELNPVAKTIGAVNTVAVDRSGGTVRLKGYNTDAPGFASTIDLFKFKKALLLGTGGAAKAVRYAMRNAKIRILQVSREKSGEGIIRYNDLTREIVEENTLIINATPLGMMPEPGLFPDIPYDFVGADHFLYDLVYNPEETEFMKKGAARGARVKNGLMMLHRQADFAFTIWENKDRPLPI
jgi:shikimate dehydrogenase